MQGTHFEAGKPSSAQRTSEQLTSNVQIDFQPLSLKWRPQTP